jgi:tetratricopeptide (TPR) repeat protein
VTARAEPVPAWRAWLRRHERSIALAYLAMVALAAVLLFFPPTRHQLLGALQGVSDRWDARWERRLAEGERLVRAGRFEEAATYLENLDRAFPAPSAEHARDQEREHTLRLLAEAYEGLGRNTRTMATYDRLIAYDPNNYHSVFLKGQAAERLLSGWAIAPEARDAYAAALLIFPSHLPSLRGFIEYHADQGEFIPIVTAYNDYLDAWLSTNVTITVGDTAVTVPVPVDGRAHELTIGLPRAADAITVSADGFAFALDQAVTVTAAVTGSSGGARAIPVPASSIRNRGLTAGDHGAWLPLGDSAVGLVVPISGDAAQVRLTMRVFKPVNRALWVIVGRSFHNLLRDAAGDSARARTVLFPGEGEADAVLLRPWWARSGLGRAIPPQ